MSRYKPYVWYLVYTKVDTETGDLLCDENGDHIKFVNSNRDDCGLEAHCESFPDHFIDVHPDELRAVKIERIEKYDTYGD